MFSPRNVMIAGAVLVAVALGSSGHGIWWLFGLLWVLPHAGRRGHRHGYACGGASRRRHDHGLPHDEPVPTSQPDPTQDRHQAFPVR